MHVGDIFAWKALPYVDPDNGGSVMEQPKTLAKAVATREERGHHHQRTYSVSTWNDLKEYAEFHEESSSSLPRPR